MFCSNCGEKLPPDAEFCPNCGAHEGAGSAASAGEQTNQNSGAQASGGAPVYSGGEKYLSPYSVNAAFSSNMFLGITILVTAGAFFMLFAFSITSFFSSVFPILFSVSLWLSYVGAKGQNSARVSTGTKMTRGITFALFIYNWVGAGIVAVCSIIFMLVPSVASSLLWDFSYYFEDLFYYGLGTAIFFLAAFIMLLVAGFIVVSNIFYTRNSEKLARSLHSAAVSGAYVAKAHVVRIWLMVLGIIACLSIFGAFSGIRAFMSSVGSCCLGASMILSSVFINRYFE